MQFTGAPDSTPGRGGRVVNWGKDVHHNGQRGPAQFTGQVCLQEERGPGRCTGEKQCTVINSGAPGGAPGKVVHCDEKRGPAPLERVP